MKELAEMKRLILPVILLSCLIFGGGCASQHPRGVQSHNANLNRLKIGMATKAVYALVGPPIRSEQPASAAGTTVDWYYVDSQFTTGPRVIKVTFTNGRVSSVQDVSAIP